MHVGPALLIVALAVGAQLPTAMADPAPEVPVEPAPPPSYLDALRSGPLAQSNDSTPGIAGLPNLSGAGNQILLGQTSNPAPPGTDPGVAPNANALNNSYLLPQNVMPSAPGEGQIVGIEPGQENADVTRREYLHRLLTMYQAGGLDGALLGQRPVGQAPDQGVSPPPG
jgi:hypothetical protein